MKRVLVAALLLSLNFASASAQGICESRAVSREGKPLAGAAKASFLKKCKRDSCRQGRQAACRCRKEKLHAKMPEGGIAMAAQERG